jgi:Tfp pilus assembly protein PilP
MKKICLSQLNLDNINFWPIQIKLIFNLFFFITLLFIAYWFDIRLQLKQLQQLSAQQNLLEQTLISKRIQLDHLLVYQRQVQENLKRPKEILETYELNSLKMAGILSESNKTERSAIIVTSNGSVYTVNIGNYVGKNFGKVIAINATNLQIEELHKRDGQWQKNLVTLKLNTGSEEREN